MCNLTDIKKGKIRVLEIRSGRNAMCRLAQLGILPGKELEVISNNMYGPVVVKLTNSRFILGSGLASKVMVERLEGEDSIPDNKTINN